VGDCVITGSRESNLRIFGHKDERFVKQWFEGGYAQSVGFVFKVNSP